MKATILAGIIGAVVTGLAIGTQSTLSSRLGSLVGALRTTVMTNLTGGVVGLTLLLALLALRGAAWWQVPGTAVTYALISGTLGVFIILGVSFSLSATGVTAGIAALIFGQMIISTIADTTGWGGVKPIPLSLSRVAGLVLLLVAVMLLLPRR